MTNDKLSELEYEALQQEKRDRMAARLQVWSLLIGLVGAFGLVSVQSGAVSYLAALYPLLAVCVARYVGHSEAVLDQVKEYLLMQERKSGYQGYEHFNCSSRRRSGGHSKALRDALVLTELLASVVVCARLVADGLLVVAVGVAVVEGVALLVTCVFLRKSSLCSVSDQ